MNWWEWVLLLLGLLAWPYALWRGLWWLFFACLDEALDDED